MALILRFFIALCFLLCCYALPDRALELGMERSWTAPMPTQEERSQGADYIRRQWKLSSSFFFGSEDVGFTADPITGNASESVMSVFYSKGSFTPSGSIKTDGKLGGCIFYSEPFGKQTFEKVLLSYDLAFASNFEWVRGGKLPGLFGGHPTAECSGGDSADGSNCFSLRPMWRARGQGEMYAYILTSPQFCDSKKSIQCRNNYGASLSRGSMKFQVNTWSKIEIFSQVNSPPTESNGVLRVWKDNQLIMNYEALNYRTVDALAFTSIYFNTFFGGNSQGFASNADTHTYFKNLQFSVGKQAAPVTSIPDSRASALMVFWTVPLVTLLIVCLLIRKE
ncbi:hypothetical protein BDF14DRAFT_1803802 [Spinellus fusiger]|nr:hypothetical protein BDF14DRAFT_1803802 [Spinellus fusiger]